MHPHIEKINVLRGIAILLVFSYHSLLVIWGPYEMYDFAPPGFWIDFAQVSAKRMLLCMTPWGMGAQGVTLFLVISGFLIHWGYLKSGAAFRFSEFFSKRFWRIYPPYLVAVLVFGISVGTGGRLSLLTHLTLTHNLFFRTTFGINPSFWSLGLEAQLYLVYPIFLLLRRWLGIGRATLATAGLALLSLALAAVLRNSHPGLWYFPLNYWFIWAVGAYLGEQFFYGKRIFTRSSYYLLGMYLVLALSTLTVVYGLLSRLLFSIFFAYVIDWYLHRPALPTSTAGKWLFKCTARIGVYSYSIYLFHQPFLQKAIFFFSFGLPGRAALSMGAVGAFAVVFVVAHFTYYAFELPSIKWGKSLYARFRRVSPTAAVLPLNT